MKTSQSLKTVIAALTLFAVAATPSARATDRFWTNTAGGNFNVSGSWSPNGVPGALDNANFTNNATYQVTWTASATNANAFFNATSGSVTQAVGSFTWLVTNSYIVGQNASTTATVTHASGTLRVTNAAVTAVLDVRRGTNRLNAGVIETDRLLLTNTAGRFEFNGGTLVSRTATISNGQDLVVGANAGFGATTWDVRSNATPTVLANGLDLGANATNSTLLLTNGATLSVGLAADGTTSARLGVNGGSANNLAIIAGPNSLWTNSGNLFVGYSGSFNTLLITNGGRVANSVTRIGFNSTADNNQVVVTGIGSLWTNSDDLRVGAAGSFNTLLIANGGQVANTLSRIGFTAGAISNQVTVTGSGSLWANSDDLRVGQSGSFNTLLITNGGRVADSLGSIGENSDSSTNQVIVTGSGSVWTNSLDLRVGVNGSFNSLLITNGGAVQASNAYVGLFVGSTNNLLNVRNGTLTVTNATSTAVLDIRHGTNQLNNNGLIEADLLRMTNMLGVFEFNGGTFNVRTSTVANGQTFFVGNGVSQADFNLVGDGAHSFAGGLTLRSNASLFGSGRISGTLSVSNGATLFPQSLVLSNSPSLAGLVFINLFMSGGFKTSHHVEVTGPLAYGGRLIIDPEALGSNPLAPGDRFPLFTASSYAGSFSIITLPSLGFGLAWSNNLLLDGSVEVVATPPADRFWTNALGGTYRIDQNWLGNLGPGPQDNAHFTNNNSYQVNWAADAAAATAFFNAGSGTVTQAIGAFSWLLTNSYVVGQNVGAVASVTHSNGTLRVTNSAGAAVLEVRRGTNRFNAGLIDADFLLLTNTAGRFEFNGGTLITRGGTISNNSFSAFNVGAGGSTPAVWDVRAGNDTLFSSSLVIGSTVANCRLFLTNGGKVFNGSGTIGDSSNNSAAFVAGAGSVWSNRFSLFVGRDGSFNQLVISNAGAVFNGEGTIGDSSVASSNAVFVVGAGSVWSNRDDLNVGASGSFNHLAVSNGGVVFNAEGIIGQFSGANSNVAFVTGSGSVWSNSTNFVVGWRSSFNELVISNGGAVFNSFGNIGIVTNADHNTVLVTGTNSLWSNSRNLRVGTSGSFNQLVVSNGATVIAEALTLGLMSESTNNRVVIHGSTVLVTNDSTTAVLEVRSGTNQFNSGLVEANQLRLITPQGFFEFNGGTLNVRTSTVANGQDFFFVGNGVSAATLNLVGNGTHSFANTLIIRSNASLIGNGSIHGDVHMHSGATLAPGPLIGKLAITEISLQGALIMEISKTGSALTNDQLEVDHSLSYKDSSLFVTTLTVTNIGPDALVAGDQFKLFSAFSYSNAFSITYLPPLDPGLTWTNKLLLNGSIQVVTVPRPQFYSINLSGTNLIFSGSNGVPNGSYIVLTSTNVALALTNWTPLLANVFDGNGNFVFTNAISPSVTQRFYALQGVDPTVFFRYGTGGTGTAGSGIPGSQWKGKYDFNIATIDSFPASWKNEGFDDSAWATLSGQTGYGNNDENSPFPKVDYDSGTAGIQAGPVYLFRSTFTINNVNTVASVTGEIKYDDAYAVYVNGIEIARATNLAAFAVLHDYATATSADNATAALAIPLASLHNGVNTIAVEVHQHDSASSDMSFDLKLQAN